MTNQIPPVMLVKTWIFIATSNYPEFTQKRFEVLKQINFIFGSLEFAYLYVEQNEDEEIEVHVI